MNPRQVSDPGCASLKHLAPNSTLFAFFGRARDGDRCDESRTQDTGVIRIALIAALGMLLLGCNMRVAGQRDADWDREAVDEKKAVPEQAVVLPPYPQDANLVEFAFGASGSHRYFVDASTLDVGADGVVRYSLVVRTTGGASNASFEGIRCKTYE